MTNLETLARDLSVLTRVLDRPGIDFEVLLRGLGDTISGLVESYLGLRMTLILDGHAITVTVMDGFVYPGDIAVSARLPLDDLSTAERGSVIVFYAWDADAFVDFAPDWGFASGFRHDRPILDGHLPEPWLVSGVTGLAEMSQLNQAIGILIGRGHTPAGARTELRRLARLTEITLAPAAQRLVHANAAAARTGKTYRPR
jgi:hypothetical protein